MPNIIQTLQRMENILHKCLTEAQAHIAQLPVQGQYFEQSKVHDAI